jgi:hypothetical protein
VAEALAEVGPTMAAAAACEVVAFVVGVTMDVPALTQFCAVAALAAFAWRTTGTLTAIVFFTVDPALDTNDAVKCARFRKSVFDYFEKFNGSSKLSK